MLIFLSENKGVLETGFLLDKYPSTKGIKLVETYFTLLTEQERHITYLGFLKKKKITIRLGKYFNKKYLGMCFTKN